VFGPVRLKQLHLDAWLNISHSQHFSHSAKAFDAIPDNYFTDSVSGLKMPRLLRAMTMHMDKLIHGFV
jgi:hypothetical protein